MSRRPVAVVVHLPLCMGQVRFSRVDVNIVIQLDYLSQSKGLTAWHKRRVSHLKRPSLTLLTQNQTVVGRMGFSLAISAGTYLTRLILLMQVTCEADKGHSLACPVLIPVSTREARFLNTKAITLLCIFQAADEMSSLASGVERSSYTLHLTKL